MYMDRRDLDLQKRGRSSLLGDRGPDRVLSAVAAWSVRARRGAAHFHARASWYAPVQPDAVSAIERGMRRADAEIDCRQAVIDRRDDERVADLLNA